MVSNQPSIRTNARKGRRLMKKYKLKLDWTDSEKSQLQTLKREETFNQAMKDLLDRGSAMGQKFNSVDQDMQIEIVKDIVDYFQNKADF